MAPSETFYVLFARFLVGRGNFFYRTGYRELLEKDSITMTSHFSDNRKVLLKMEQKLVHFYLEDADCNTNIKILQFHLSCAFSLFSQ